MERTRRKLLYTAAVVAAAPFVPGFVQGQSRLPGRPGPTAAGDPVMDEILQLQTRGLRMAAYGVPTPEGIRTQAAAVRMFAAHAQTLGVEPVIRREAANERTRRRGGRVPRRVEEPEIRDLLLQRGVDDSQFVLPVPDPAAEDRALLALSETGFTETLTAIATAMEDLAVRVEKRGGVVRIVQQENEPFSQSPEAIFCSNLTATHLAAGAATAVACALPPNLVCPFMAGVYAGLTVMMITHGCY